MERRFLPAVYDRGKTTNGAYCTLWEGWKTRPGLDVTFQHRGQARHWAHSPRSLDGPGVYAFLYWPSNDQGARPYVLYIGSGKAVVAEVKKKAKTFIEKLHRQRTGGAVAVVETLNQAHVLEYDLIRYYSPPWNTAFRKQPRRRLRSKGKRRSTLASSWLRY